MKHTNVKPAEGKLGILVVGCGAVATTFMTGVLMVRKGLAKPIGSMTQYDKIRVGRGAEKQYLPYGDIVPLAQLDDIVFGTWDVYPQNAFQAAMYAQVLDEKDIIPVKAELEQIVPMKAAFDKNYVKRIDGDNIKCTKHDAPCTIPSRWEMVDMLRQDIRDFKAKHDCSRVVVLWAASTEIYVPVDERVHYHLADLEAAMKADDREHVAPSMCYAYAALSEGAPFIMGALNITVDIPAMCITTATWSTSMAVTRPGPASISDRSASCLARRPVTCSRDRRSIWRTPSPTAISATSIRRTMPR